MERIFMKKFLALFFSCFILHVHAAKVDTISLQSASMGKAIKAVVISPEGKIPSSTLYLLHGYSGSYSDWVNKAPNLKKLVDFYGYLIVCPDGGFDSWYWDTEDPNFQYESFIIKELIPEVEKEYKVSSTRENRAITGLSMGGHGALYLAFRHQDIFAYAGSTSGGVDIRPFPHNWNIKDRIGPYSQNPDNWDKHTVMELTHLVEPGKLQLFIDCGTEDFFLGVNNKLHEKLNYLNIPHAYLTMPGKHDWNYWNQSISHQMAFFDTCFEKQDRPKK